MYKTSKSLNDIFRSTTHEIQMAETYIASIIEHDQPNMFDIEKPKTEKYLNVQRMDIEFDNK